MGNFELSREGANKLWVGTPFSVSRNAWGFFVKDWVFPGFYISEPPVEGVDTWPSGGDIGRWGECRYLLRDVNPDLSEKWKLTDGEKGNYWTHAELPDDQRSGLNTSCWGVIYIPHPCQVHYLSVIESGLGPASVQRRSYCQEELEKLISTERATLEGLFRELQQVSSFDPQPKNTLEFRNAMTVRRGYLKEHRIGKLPMTYSSLCQNIPCQQNIFTGQIELDFFRTLDGQFRNYRSLSREGVGEIVESMRAAYGHLISVPVDSSPDRDFLLTPLEEQGPTVPLITITDH